VLKKSQTLKSTSCANSVAGLGKEEALLSVAPSPLDGTTMGASLDVSGLPRLARPLRVLLVEDDASIREAINKLVNTFGHRAHVTQNVREALDLAVSENEAFDLLLSDISLPDGDGWELLRCLTDGGRRPWRAIAMSGRSSMEDLARSQTAGFEQHLLKPVAPAIVEAILREAAQELPRG
jgi:CheY-like chemotaxis protein